MKGFEMNNVQAQGRYCYKVNDGEWVDFDNLVTTEGLNHILNVALGETAKPSGYYIALFGGAATPAANWTAASFPTAANEITSNTEGYTSATRPLWKPKAAANGAIGNVGDEDLALAAKVTIATASSLNVTGMALLTASGKGAQTGVLVSAAKMPVARTLQNGDTLYIGYRLTLTA